jgi:hypothetical protein
MLAILQHLFKKPVILFHTPLATFNYGLKNGGVVLSLVYGSLMQHVMHQTYNETQSHTPETIRTKAKHKETRFKSFKLSFLSMWSSEQCCVANTNQEALHHNIFSCLYLPQHPVLGTHSLICFPQYIVIGHSV